MLKMGNKPQSEMTANPSKYPQGYFKEKPCKMCSTIFKPLAPSHGHCSQKCADESLVNRYYQRTYKVSLKTVKEMLEKQNNLCAICNTVGFDMFDMTKGQLVVDHCHSTGVVRGMLCHNCNRGLGLFQDNKEFLKTAIKYLEGATTIP